MERPPVAPVSSEPAPIGRWARLALTFALVPLTLALFRRRPPWILGLSDIDTAIHEFGHMLFMPFGFPILGETMVILGGSLTQVVFPLLFVGYFLQRVEGRMRDPHAATVCLWWTAANLVEVSVYMADARARELTLLNGLTGQESDGHDWYNLLSRWHVLSRDVVYAERLRLFAGVLCFTCIVWGVWAALTALPRPAAEK